MKKLIAILFMTGCYSMGWRGPSLCVPSELNNIAIAAVQHWNRSGAAFDQPACEENATSVRVQDLGSNTLGKTILYVDHAEIFLSPHTVEHLQDSEYFSSSARNLCHEMGHAMGFEHVADSNSCMSVGWHPLVDYDVTDIELVKGLK